MKLRRVAVTLLSVAAVLPALTAPAGAGDHLNLRFPQPHEDTEFVDSWGAARSEGRSHRGTDLMATKMMPVVAALDGVVETMRWGTRSGYYIKLRHADDVTTWYMHLNDDTPGTDDGRGGPGFAFAPGLEVGDTVTAGQLIGYVGDSGNAEGAAPHTHFELHLGRTAVNPYGYLVDAWERWELELAIELGLTDFK